MTKHLLGSINVHESPSSSFSSRNQNVALEAAESNDDRNVSQWEVGGL